MTSELIFRVVRALYYQNGTAWNYHQIRYPFSVVYLIISGDGHIRANGELTDLLPGNAYLIPADLEHDLWCDHSIEKVYVDFHLEQIPGLDVFEEYKHVLIQPIDLSRVHAINQALAGGLRERLYVRGELELLLSNFITKPLQPFRTGIERFLPLLEDIHRHLSAQIRISKLAANYGWNPSSFSRAFKQAIGCNIKEYVEKVLATRLCEELITTDKTLHSLAAEYGFSDPYYLSAFFKRRYGCSPTEYRRTSRPKPNQGNNDDVQIL